MKEEWKDVKGYEGLYEISNLGRVKSLAKQLVLSNGVFRNRKEMFLKPHTDGDKYLSVALYKEKMSKMIKVHLLVWDMFGSKKRNGIILQVDHIDNDKNNNKIENLQLLTARENTVKYHKSIKHSSKHTGVSWHKVNKGWQSSIRINGILNHLGYFINEVDASNEYRRALKEFNETGNVTVNTPMKKRKSSKYKGVAWHKLTKKWVAQIGIDNHKKYLGLFKKEYDAHLAYQKALGEIL